MLKKINRNEIKVGEALPWTVYDDAGRLLLNEGNIVPSERILLALLEHGVYRISNPNEADELINIQKNKQDPFSMLNECVNYLQGIFTAIEDKDNSSEHRVKQLVKGITQLCHHHGDAMLGAVHLCDEGPYTLWHPMSVAILSELVAKRLQFPDIERYAVIATALTSNIGMRQLQEELVNQTTPLTDQQKQKLHVHPAKSAEMLMETGITNVEWIRAVFQHHERVDGSGYPEGISGGEICRAAKVVAIADRYAAMVRGRAYRKAIHGKDTLRELLIENGKMYDQELSLVLISELGIYPPGSIVQLKCGEVGMVVNRGKRNATIPLVASFIDLEGKVLGKPVLRNCVAKPYAIRDKFEYAGDIPFSLGVIWSANYSISTESGAA